MKDKEGNEIEPKYFRVKVVKLDTTLPNSVVEMVKSTELPSDSLKLHIEEEQKTNFIDSDEQAKLVRVTGGVQPWNPSDRVEESESSTDRLKPLDLLRLRKTPDPNLSEDVVKEMLEKYNFYSIKKNGTGKGVNNRFDRQPNSSVILDSLTGLMWQRSGTLEPKSSYQEAETYVIEELNNKKFAGYIDWRLPTLEEAMSLMEREMNKDELYIDPKFNKTQEWIWTVDQINGSNAWVVNFHGGDCLYYNDPDSYTYGIFVRAVRSAE
ncbi:MAG: DUF1566 domain-containing protein [bacterium]